MNGRIMVDEKLILDAAGMSGVVDLSTLRQGMYVALWQNHSARFIR